MLCITDFYGFIMYFFFFECYFILLFDEGQSPISGVETESSPVVVGETRQTKNIVSRAIRRTSRGYGVGVLQVVRLFGSDGVTIGSQPPPPVLIAADHPPEQRDVVQIGDDEVIPKALGQHSVKDYPKPPSSS
jgi:hypothetical protein